MTQTSGNALSEFVEILFRTGVDESLRLLVASVQTYAGADRPGRSSDLFGAKGAAGLLRHMRSGLKGVENIYTQHTPLLAQTLEQLAKVLCATCLGLCRGIFVLPQTVVPHFVIYCFDWWHTNEC